MNKIIKILIGFLLFLSAIHFGFGFEFNLFPEDIAHEIDNQMNAEVLAVLKNNEPKDFLAQEDFQNLCLNHIFTCFKTKFEGNFSWEEKYIYLSQVIYLTNFFERTNKDFHKYYESITFTKNKKSKRGYQRGKEIEINVKKNYSYNQTFQVLTHEMFHIRDIIYLKGNNPVINKNFTEGGIAKFSVDDPSINFYKITRNKEKDKKSNKEEDFCSLYGQTDIFEDLAECGNLYVNHYKVFKYLARINPVMRQKFNFFQKFFKGNYIQADYKNLKLFINYPNLRPADTTSL